MKKEQGLLLGNYLMSRVNPIGVIYLGRYICEMSGTTLCLSSFFCYLSDSFLDLSGSFLGPSSFFSYLSDSPFSLSSSFCY